MKPSEFLINNSDGTFFKSNGVVTVVDNDVTGLMDELDTNFISKDKLIDIDAGTCLGLEFHKIQMMIDYFRKRGYSPYKWEEFNEQIKLMR